MVEYSDKHLASRLRILLEDQEITIKEAAEAIDVPYRTLQNQLAGNNKMPASTFAKLIEMLDVPASFIGRGRLRLDRNSLAKALQTALGSLLPTVDDEFNFHPAPNPDTRSPERREQDAKALGFRIAEQYEWQHAFLRFPRHQVDT